MSKSKQWSGPMARFCMFLDTDLARFRTGKCSGLRPLRVLENLYLTRALSPVGYR